MNLQDWFNYRFKLVKVYGHPRSGNHLLMATLAKNFFSDYDLSTVAFPGHWENPQDSRIVQYGKLWGNHLLKPVFFKRGIYIYRDGRDVCVSMYKRRDMRRKEDRDINFSTYLRRVIDWEGIPGCKAISSLTLPEHWARHLDNWRDTGIFMVRFEDLVQEPINVLERIAKYFNLKYNKLTAVESKVGINPNEAKIGTWREYFSGEDLRFFNEKVGNHWGLYNI